MRKFIPTDECWLCKVAVFTTILASIACNLKQVVDPTPNLSASTSDQNKKKTEEFLSDENSSDNSSYNRNLTPPPRTDMQSTDQASAQAPTEVLATATPVANIETLLSTCPTQDELDLFNNDFHILFDSAIALPPYECQNGTGLSGQVNSRLALYQGLGVIHALHFDQYLPWTQRSLYAWLKESIHGIVLTDAEYSYCCQTGKQIVLKADLLSQPDYQFWVNPQSGAGLMGLVGVLIHEARHAEIGGHTCGTNDASLEELGAWGVQYYLFLYMAENTSATFFSQAQRQMALDHADTALARICNP